MNKYKERRMAKIHSIELLILLLCVLNAHRQYKFITQIYVYLYDTIIIIIVMMCYNALWSHQIIESHTEWLRKSFLPFKRKMMRVVVGVMTLVAHTINTGRMHEQSNSLAHNRANRLTMTCRNLYLPCFFFFRCLLLIPLTLAYAPRLWAVQHQL